MDVMSGLSMLLNLENIPLKKVKISFKFAIPVITVLLVCLSIFVFYKFSEPSLLSMLPKVVYDEKNREVYETAVGGNEVINLSDGSIVKLNTATRLEVNMSDTYRNITLIEGEAYFEVAHNKNVPFVVAVGGAYVEALGTAFGVQKVGDHVEVTVTEGLVQVKHKQGSSVGRRKSTLKPVLLRAGQVGRINELGQQEIMEIEQNEIARRLLWRQKMLAFNGETLREVIDEFSRYTTLKIDIVDAETAAIRVGGYFRSDDIASLLTSLENNFAITVNQTSADSFTLKKSQE
jgi:transmembrane sensor